MRRMIFGIVCIASLATAACNKPPEKAAPEGANVAGEAAASDDLYTVNAGPVANANVGSLSGWFKMLKAPAQGIPSDRLGGACLVFAAADLGFTKMAAKSCTKNSDCYTGEGESAGYCDGKTHACWAKPSTFDAANALCDKGKVFPLNVQNPIPVTPIDASKWVKPGAKVRVTACINKKGFVPGPNGTGCPTKDGTDRIEELGPIATVK